MNAAPCSPPGGTEPRVCLSISDSLGIAEYLERVREVRRALEVCPYVVRVH